MDITKYGKFTCIDMCRACGKVTSAIVIDSRIDSSQTVRVRRKKCQACGYRWNTVEINESDLLELGGVADRQDLELLKNLSDGLSSKIKYISVSMAKMEKTSKHLSDIYNREAARKREM